MPRGIRGPLDVEPIKPYHQFQKKIPIEIRCMIWRYTLPDEQIHELVLVDTGDPVPDTVELRQKKFRFTTPHPVALYVNRESRNEAQRFFTFSMALRDLFLPLDYPYKQKSITLNTPGVKKRVLTIYDDSPMYDDFRGETTTERFGLLLKREPRTWVNYEHDIFYINHHTFFSTCFSSWPYCYWLDVANSWSPRDAKQIQHLAIDIEVLIRLPSELNLRSLLSKLTWLPSLRTVTLVYYDHSDETGYNFPDRHRGKLVLTDNIDHEDSKWGVQNLQKIYIKFQYFLAHQAWRIQPTWQGEPGAERKRIFEAEKHKLQNEIDEAKIKNPDLKVPEFRWKYAMRKGIFNLGHFEGLGANI